VLAALAEGDLPARRLESYHRLRREAEAETARQSARLAELGGRHKARR
jgi:hypothetical protein